MPQSGGRREGEGGGQKDVAETAGNFFIASSSSPSPPTRAVHGHGMAPALLLPTFIV